MGFLFSCFSIYSQQYTIDCQHWEQIATDCQYYFCNPEGICGSCLLLATDSDFWTRKFFPFAMAIVVPVSNDPSMVQQLERSLETIMCKTVEEIRAKISQRWPVVVVMTVKGNLRHRILKLGPEKAVDELTPSQSELRKIALQQKCRDVISKHAERPTWGGGAFYYCEPGHLQLVKETMHRFPFSLQSKHIVCSPAYEKIVEECLSDHKDKSLFKGHEAFVFKRSGKVQQYDVVELPACPKLEVDDLYGGQFDVDLSQHMASPPGFQSAYPEAWDDIWEQVHEQEPGLLKPIPTEDRTKFSCVTCGDRALMTVQHVCLGSCSTQLLSQSRGDSLFKAIWKTAQHFPPQVYHIEDLSRIEDAEVQSEDGCAHFAYQ